MWPVSAAFKAAVVSGHMLPVVRVAAMWDGAELGELRIRSGRVTADCRRDGPLRTLELECLPSDDAWDWLTRYGAEIAVWRGLTLPGGDELVPQGVFVVDSDIDEDGDGSMKLSAADRSARIARARWTDPYVVESGIDVTVAVRGILLDRWPSCPVSMETTGIELGARLVLEEGSGSNPWKDARSIASDHGLDLYFDGSGVARLRPVPDPAIAVSCAVYGTGELSMELDRRRRASLSSVCNGVVATGEGTGVDAPVRGESWDDDPASPTYRYGPLGQIPYFYSSPLLTTDEQAQIAATTIRSRLKGRTKLMTWAMVPNPAHEPFDVIEAAGGRHMLDQITLSLSNEAMTAVGREQVF